MKPSSPMQANEGELRCHEDQNLDLNQGLNRVPILGSDHDDKDILSY
jgi:hypothetical protein